MDRPLLFPSFVLPWLGFFEVRLLDFMEAGHLSSATQALVDKWLAWDKNETTRKEVIELVAKNDESTLSKALSKRIAFGTAGLRGRMCAGFAFMNEVTVIQAAQGLCRYFMKLMSKYSC